MYLHLLLVVFCSWPTPASQQKTRDSQSGGCMLRLRSVFKSPVIHCDGLTCTDDFQ